MRSCGLEQGLVGDLARGDVDTVVSICALMKLIRGFFWLWIILFGLFGGCRFV